jgi:putative cardiolipin synthase
MKHARLKPGTDNFVRLLFLLTLLPAFSFGCRAQPLLDDERTVSHAIEDYQATSAGHLFEDMAAQHSGQSGFALMKLGRAAFTSRIAMTELAERTLDLQYYIWEGDKTGRILAERLVRAADRGVRVRVLIDDNGLGGSDAGVASLDAHPNIEIRIFNPFATRGFHAWDFITDFKRVNHRMHNKIMVMDNAVAIVGGRNIGDHYFGVNTNANYRDLDIVAGGPIVREISNVFDYFWNGDWAVPIKALVDETYSEPELKAEVQRIRNTIAADEYPYPLDDDLQALRERLREIRDNLIWAEGGIVYDDPAAVEEATMNEAMHRKFDTLEKELLIESAYFVPGDRGVAAAAKLEEKGVRVRILTNSLASNDVVAAHAGYAKYRKELIENGVEMHELRPDIVKDRKTSIISGLGESKAALHTKALVFDSEAVFIGSFNLDPRSANINTEAGLYVESKELAARLTEYMDEGTAPENSYRVILDGDDDLYWVARNDEGEEIRFEKEPQSTFWQRFMSGLIGLLPVESQL